MRVAARLAYWGPAYHGHARQPDVETVEGDLIRALTRIRAIRDPRSARLAVASRTDRGVSAIANIVAFDSSLPPIKLPGATCGRMHDAWLWSCIPVPDSFNPRHARRRKYRYHFPAQLSIGRLRETGQLFQGEHDFASFTVGRVGGRLTIDRIRIRREAGFIMADFEAERFARGLLRRLAGAMEAHARGEVKKAELRNALRGGPLRSPLAPPEGLFLLDVDCGLTWTDAPDRCVSAFHERLHATALAHRFAHELTEAILGNDRPPRR